MPRIDAHQHYWSLTHTDYGWLQPVPELAAIYRDFTPVDLHPLLDAARIDATVLVQAAPSEAETWRLLEIARKPSSRVLGVVGWCDLLAPDAEARIRRLAAEPLLKGLRPMLQDIPDPRWILDARLTPAIDAMVQTDLAFDALVKPIHLAHLLECLLRHPNLRTVVDHGAKPAIAARAFQPWADDMARIARQTQAFCKLSGLPNEAGAGTAPSDMRPYVEHLLAEFGPSRLIWGSDWPVVTLACSYAQWVETSQTWLAPLSADEQAQVMDGNARAFYRLGSGCQQRFAGTQ
jgi:L-fuconolactonase